MPSPPFPPRPAPSRKDDLHGGGCGQPRAPPNTSVRSPLPPNDALHMPRSILRPTPLSYISTPHDPTASPQIPRPQPPPPIPHSTTASPYHHHHTSSSPELRPRVDNAWAPRVRPYPQQHPSDLSQTGNTPSPTHPSSHIVPRPRADLDDATQRRSGFAVRVNPHFVPGIRGRSASDVRIVHTPPPDLDPDRLARACGQPALINFYRHDDRGRPGVPIDAPSSHLKDPGSVRNADAPPSHPPLPKIRVGHMYRRLDALARRSSRRAMDYISFEDVAVIHKRDSQLREQLRRKRSERLQEKDPSFHAIGAPLEDVLLYASTTIVIGDYQYHLPTVVVACVEELTKTGYGLFRALPSRDRHLQLIDLFDKSPDFGAHFNMRGQAMPDVCALLSTFISSLPTPLLDPHIYSAFWQWSVKPSVKREDTRRDRHEEEEEERRARGEPPHPDSWMRHTDLYLDDSDIALETDQIAMAQILLRFLPSANLSLLVYLCGFFTQLPLCPENGLQLEDVARIFGHRLLGGSVKVVSQRMMMWLLTRWHRISETLFGDMCGMTPPPSPPCAPHPRGSDVAAEGGNERIEKRKGERESGSEDALRHTRSSSSSQSSPSTESPEDHGVASRKSSSDEEEEGESYGSSRRRKKRELDVQKPRARPPSTRKESRHGHGHGRRGSGSRRHHHHGHSSEHKNAPTSPDPFPLAFAKAQLDLADAPLLTPPPSGVARGESRESRAQFETPNLQPLDTPVRIARPENDSRRTDVDIRVVDALLQETAVATDVARALAERVEVLERALQVRRGEEGQVERPIVHHSGGEGEGGGEGTGDGEGEDRKRDGDKDMEDGLRLQLRLVEAERDKAQRIVRDVKAYLLDDGSALQRG
ncbi:hypothetical protein OG21DRAFT_1486906 [Imleria badia]|nr:hypothetical protein OG21DRAFT_1486906 [Imleria badia]